MVYLHLTQKGQKDAFHLIDTVMGGLDIQTTLGFGNYDRLRKEITGVLEMFKERGLLYCTTHFVQDHCTIDELKFAYDLVYRTVRAG